MSDNLEHPGTTPEGPAPDSPNAALTEMRNYLVRAADEYGAAHRAFCEVRERFIWKLAADAELGAPLEALRRAEVGLLGAAVGYSLFVGSAEGVAARQLREAN